MGGVSERLRAAAQPLWQAQLEHPFVRGLADGSLEPARFRHFIKQDYLFLIEYARVLALGCARAPRLPLMQRFAHLTQLTLTVEMDLHRGYAAQCAIPAEELDREPMTPTTRAYTDFLVHTAATGDYAELLAALLPCLWGYSELGRQLVSRRHPRYSRRPGHPRRGPAAGGVPDQQLLRAGVLGDGLAPGAAAGRTGTTTASQ